MRNNFRGMFRNVNPAIVIIIIILIANRLLYSNQSPGEWLYSELLMLPGIIMGLTFHEAAHAFVSSRLGDPTPKMYGRLSLDPLRHIDPVGFLALLFAGFGWGQPVAIDPRYYKHRRRDEFFVALAGVAANLVIAFLSSLALRLIVSISGGYLFGVWETLFLMVYYIMTINIMLMIFNLLPVPPLDGFGILTQIFRLDRYSWYRSVYDNGFFILMILIIFNITDRILTPGISFFINLFF